MRYARIIGRGTFLNYIFFLIFIINKKIQIKWPLNFCMVPPLATIIRAYADLWDD